MDGVQRGDIKKVAGAGTVAQAGHFSGGPTWSRGSAHSHSSGVLARWPVEDDGSGPCFESSLPTRVFVALDEHDMSVQRMHSFVSGDAGRRQPAVSAVMNHDRRPPQRRRQRSCRPCSVPSKTRLFEGLPDVVDFPRDINRFWIDTVSRATTISGAMCVL